MGEKRGLRGAHVVIAAGAAVYVLSALAGLVVVIAAIARSLPPAPLPPAPSASPAPTRAPSTPGPVATPSTTPSSESDAPAPPDEAAPPAPAPPPAPAQAPLPAPAPPPPPPAPVAVDVPRVLELVNAERANAGLAPLVASASLGQAAREHASWMAQTGQLVHSSPPGGMTWGENIAQGYPSAEAVVAGWMGSDGHRANILNPAFTSMGVGYVAAGNYWAQQFGG